MRSLPVSGPGRWESGTRLWTTAPSCPCISSGRPGGDRPILRIGLSRSSPLDHYWLGQCIAQSVEALDRCAVFIASGELSHKLREDGPYGFAPEGPEFDRQITEAMAAGDFLRFLTMDPTLCDRAAECGLRSFQIMAGALDGLAMESKLLSYEGVTGVGYGVATFTVTGPDEDRRFGERCAELERTRLAEKKVSEDAWVKLARLSLETFVKTGKRLKRLPGGLPAEMTAQTAGPSSSSMSTANSEAASAPPGQLPRAWPGRSCRTPFPPAPGIPVFHR